VVSGCRLKPASGYHTTVTSLALRELDRLKDPEGHERLSSCISVKGNLRAFLNFAMNFVFHKMCGVAWVAEELMHVQEGLCSKQLSILLICNGFRNASDFRKC